MDNSKGQQTDMPEWLRESVNYIPQADKDTFVNKSILSVFRVLSRIKMQESVNTPLSKINVTIKVLFTFTLLLLVSITKSFVFLIIVDVYLLLFLCIMDADNLVRILRMSLGAALFTAVILLPALLWGNRYTCIMTTSKVFTTVTAMGLLSYTTKWSAITEALKRFHIPDIFTLILDITIKYLYLLGEFSVNMLYALKLRSVGKNKNKYTSMAGIAGTVFLKSKEMAEDMYQAMECRGFSGEYYSNKTSKLKLADYLYITVNLGFIVLFVYFERI